MLLPAMRRLDARQTRDPLRRHGLETKGAPAFAFRDSAPQTFYDWHVHPNHQLIFALEGPTQIETETARYLLPLGRAAWIPAGVWHRTLLTDAEGSTLYLAGREVVGTWV